MPFNTLDGTKIPVRIWTDIHGIEPQAVQQIRDVARQPHVDRVAVMPDVHLGFGCTIGTVIASRTAVLPSAVGVDIGCGMTAVKTSLTAADLPDDLGALRTAIEARIPVGFSAHSKDVNVRALGLDKGWDAFWKGFNTLHANVSDLEGRFRAQCGTLGGGNHFLEVTLDEDGTVWLMLHSGSRNAGKTIAEQHIKIAKAQEHNKGLTNSELAALLSGTPEMAAYRNDLFWAQEYALRNRQIMMALFQQALVAALPQTANITFGEVISAHHNYVAEEEYDGQRMLVTRKGAIRAGKGDLGIIPGSMGDSSFIVRGLGNDLALNSASHGAGRKMSRGEAKRRFTVEDLAAQTSGIECRKDAGVLDEIPGAYKAIDEVMAHQSDLVEVVARLRQVVCVKG